MKHGKGMRLSVLLVAAGMTTVVGCGPAEKTEDVGSGDSAVVSQDGAAAAGSGQSAKGVAAISEECSGNLRQLHLALRMYANEHDGALPSTWSELHPEFFPNLSVLLCPDAGGGVERALTEDNMDTAADYEYIPGLSMARGSSQPQEAIVIREKPGHHDQRGFHVVRLNGSLEWMPE